MKLLYETESESNKLAVYEENGIRYLRVGKGFELHSSYDPKEIILQPETQNYWNYFLILPAMTKVKKILLLGLGAGTIARQYAHFYPTIEIDAIEIDQEIVRIGKEYFDMKNKNLKVYIEDAEKYVERCKEKYDIIILDAFTGGNLDKKLLTRKFFAKMKELLNEGGILSANYCSDMGVPYLLKKACTQNFKHMIRVPNPGTYNYILFASDEKMSFEGMVLKEELEKLGEYCRRRVVVDK